MLAFIQLRQFQISRKIMEFKLVNNQKGHQSLHRSGYRYTKIRITELQRKLSDGEFSIQEYVEAIKYQTGL